MLMELASRLLLEGDASLGMGIDDVGMLGVSAASFAGILGLFCYFFGLWVDVVGKGRFMWSGDDVCVMFSVICVRS